MVQKVSHYQSSDGKLHDTEERAMQHEANLWRKALVDFIDRTEDDNKAEGRRRSREVDIHPAPRTIGHCLAHDQLKKLTEKITMVFLWETRAYGGRAACPREFLMPAIVAERLDQLLAIEDQTMRERKTAAWMRELRTGKKEDDLDEES